MNDRINLFKRLMEKFIFQEPASIDIQMYMLAEKRGVLVSTLKSAGDYSFYYGQVLRVYFKARRIGLSLTVPQSGIILGIISAISVLFITFCIIFSYKYWTYNNSKDDSIIKRDIYKKEIDKKGIDNKDNSDNKQIPLAHYSIGIQSFFNENVDSTLVMQVTNRIFTKLKGIKGGKYITSLGNPSRSGNFKMILTGSVGKLGEVVMISAKLVDVKTGKVLFATSRNVNSEVEINTVCDSIARQVADGFY